MPHTKARGSRCCLCLCKFKLNSQLMSKTKPSSSHLTETPLSMTPSIICNTIITISIIQILRSHLKFVSHFKLPSLVNFHSIPICIFSMLVLSDNFPIFSYFMYCETVLNLQWFNLWFFNFTLM